MEISQINLEEWSANVEPFSRNNFFQDHKWLELVSDEFGLRNYFFKVKEDGFESFFSLQVKGRDAYSNFIGYGGIASLQDCSDIFDRLIPLIEKRLNVVVRRIKLFPGVEIKESKGWKKENSSILQINHGWNIKIEKRTRNSLTQAIKGALIIKRVPLADLSEFYEVYTQTAERVKSTYKTPKTFFEKLLSFSEILFIGAYKDNSMVAASIFMRSNEWVYYWWNVSSVEGLKTNANYLILFEAITSFEKQGVKFLDMASSNNLGISSFKAQWGAESVPFWIFES